MKKIFRMALVFALAGATLMYTGCTKDYSEDINKLDSEISSLENEYKALSDELASLKSGVASLEAAYKAADSALENKLAGQIADIEKKLNGKIAEIENAIDKKADKADVEAQIKALKDEALKLAEDLQKKLDEFKGEVNDKLAEAQNKLDEALAALTNELRSLVFVPDFYFAGIEATSYSISDFDAYLINALKGDNEFIGQKVTFSKGAKLGVIPEAIGTITDPAGTPLATNFVSINNTPAKNKQGQAIPYTYTKGASAVAYYDLNPSSFPVDDAEWALYGQDRTIVNVVAVKGEAPKVWAPKVLSVASEDGVAAVTFEIENPELLVASTLNLDSKDETFGIDIDKTNKTVSAQGNAPVMQLVATLSDGKTISSDWEAVIPDVDSLGHLAFTKESKYTTTIACGNDKVVLYPGAFQTLANDPSIAWKYNAGPLDLAKVINIHMFSSVSGESTYSFEEFSAKYPGFTMNFEAVPYTIGDEKTSEDSYSALEGSVFTPCWVNADGDSETIAKDADYGISAVGRLPMFLVTLCEPSGKVVLHGYFKVEITPEDAVYAIKPIDVKNFGKLPYICSTELSTKWYEFSANVLENLKVDYKQFLGSYGIIENGKTTITKVEQAHTYSAEIFVYDEENDDYVIAYVLGKDGKPTKQEVDFGTITYSVDATGNGVNDSFTWSFDKAQAENIKKYNDVYVLFKINDYTGAAFKFSAEIAEPVELTFGKINPKYWFEDVEAGVQNTVRANVLVPQSSADYTATTSKVTDFSKNLDDNFIGNQLMVQLKEGADEIYAKYFDGKNNDDFDTEYTYKFAQEQPVINGIPLIASKDGKYLYAAKMKADGKTPDLDAKGNLQIHSLIASFNGKSIKYTNETSRAKELLNLWGKEETDVAKMLYANVQVDFAAGDSETDCAIAIDSSVFHVRFIRPLDIVGQATDGLADAVPGGDVIYLGNLINAIDWNDNEPDPIFKWHAMPTAANAPDKFEGFVADTYKTAANDTIVWFSYYGINKVKVDAADIEIDQTGSWEKLSKVNSAAKVYLAQIQNKAFVPVAGGVANLAAPTKEGGFYKLPDLMNYLLVYENNMGVVDDFNIKVPVTLYYYWGEISADVVIPVKATYVQPGSEKEGE